MTDTIEEKLENILQTKEDIKDALEYIGASVTSATLFSAYAALIRTSFDSIETINNVLKTLVEGEENE